MGKDLSIFISPHLDDAALSCGGMIRRLTREGQRVIVATTFTADLAPEKPVSWLAQRNQRSWDLPVKPFAARREEDRRAMAELGAEALHLGFLDAMYRTNSAGEAYYQKITVGIPVHYADEAQTLPQLQEKFRELAAQFSGYVISPLALGGHVDHILVRRAIESVWAAEQILYYEDYPYAGRSGVMQEWLYAEEKAEKWKLLEVPLSEDEVAARIAAVACYQSQLRGLFPSRLEQLEEIARARLDFMANRRFFGNPASTLRRMETSLRDYIAHVGGECYRYRQNYPTGNPIPFLGTTNILESYSK